LDWASLFLALVIVISAIGLGLLCSWKVHSHQFNIMANYVRLYAFIQYMSMDILLTQHSCVARKRCRNCTRDFFGNNDKYRWRRHKDLGTRLEVLRRCSSSLFARIDCVQSLD
jgi:hypothetical protein